MKKAAVITLTSEKVDTGVIKITSDKEGQCIMMKRIIINMYKSKYVHD